MDPATIFFGIIAFIALILALYALIRKNKPEADDFLVLVQHSTERLDPEDYNISVMTMFPNAIIITANQYNQVNGALLFKMNPKSNPKNDKFYHLAQDSLSNYHMGIVGNTWTSLNGDNSIVASKSVFGLGPIPSNPFLKGARYDFLTMLVLVDSIGPVTVYNFTQVWWGYTDATSAKNIYGAFSFIKSRGDSRFVIQGDFNLAGSIWSQIAERVFGDSIIHSWTPGLITCSDPEGIAAPDGIIVSKTFASSMYCGVKRMRPATSLQHFVLYAKLGTSGRYTDPESLEIIKSQQRSTQNYTQNIPWSNDWIQESKLVPDTRAAVPTLNLQQLFVAP